VPLINLGPAIELAELSLNLRAWSSFFIDLSSVALLKVSHMVSQLTWDVRFLLWVGLK
jgi:hypothetical protein